MNNDPDVTVEEAWIAKEREKVIAHLASQRCNHAGGSKWPAFHIDPYVALWTFQSPTTPGCKGCWAISGDIPTGCFSCNSGQDPRAAMRHFSAEWLAASEAMERGEANEGIKIGTPDQWPTMAPLLKSRAEILSKYADDDDLWQDRPN